MVMKYLKTYKLFEGLSLEELSDTELENLLFSKYKSLEDCKKKNPKLYKELNKRFDSLTSPGGITKLPNFKSEIKDRFYWINSDMRNKKNNYLPDKQLMRIKNALNSYKIEDLGLPKTLIEKLKKFLYVETIEDLFLLDPDIIIRREGIGKTSLELILNAMQKIGLEMKGRSYKDMGLERHINDLGILFKDPRFDNLIDKFVKFKPSIFKNKWDGIASWKLETIASLILGEEYEPSRLSVTALETDLIPWPFTEDSVYECGKNLLVRYFSGISISGDGGDVINKFTEYIYRNIDDILDGKIQNPLIEFITTNSVDAPKKFNPDWVDV